MVSFAYWQMHLSELLNFRTPELLKTSLNTMHILVSRFSAFGDVAMTAMFIGLITAYMGSYIGQLVQLQNGALVVTGQYLQLVAMGFSALAMGVFAYFAEKKKMAWLDNFSIAGSMLVGMAAAVICEMIF